MDAKYKMIGEIYVVYTKKAFSTIEESFIEYIIQDFIF